MSKKTLIEHLKVNFLPLLMVVIIMLVAKIFPGSRYSFDSNWMYLVAFLAVFGWGIIKSYDAIKLFFETETSNQEKLTKDLALSKQGDADSLYAMAIRHLNGDKVEKNIKEANRIFLKLSNEGHGLSQNALALSYLSGTGLKKNIDEALKWFKKASENNVGEAFAEIGKIKLKDNTEESNRESFHMFQKASELGHAEGVYLLSVLYLTGKGVAMDRRKGLDLLNEAALKGCTKAIDHLPELLDGKMSFN